jgi:hypothetical protein
MNCWLEFIRDGMVNVWQKSVQHLLHKQDNERDTMETFCDVMKCEFNAFAIASQIWNSLKHI